MRSPARPTNAGLAVLLLIAIAAAAAIIRPTESRQVKPCGDTRPVTIGGSMVVGCRPRLGP
jgi:hypothetical protein